MREHRLPLPRLVGMSDALPLAADCVDVVYASWVLEHLNRPVSTFDHIARVLKPGGSFIFITPNRRHPLVALNRIVGRTGRLQQTIINRLYGRAGDDTFPAYYRANTANDLRHLAQAVDLQLTTLHHIPDPTYLAFNNSLFRLMRWIDARLSANRQLHLVGCLQKSTSKDWQS